METFKQKLGKVSITVDKDEHSLDKEYDKLVVVYKKTAYTETVYGETVTKYNYRTYISRKPVPIGKEITNKDYWIQLGSVEEHIAIDYNKFKDEVNAFLNSFIAAEDDRVLAENIRISTEISRIENENIRETQETVRKEYEDARILAENVREQQEGSPTDEPDSTGSRWARYKKAEDLRDTSYYDKESKRDTSYTRSEQNRNNSYNTAEGQKTDVPNLNGSRWAQYKANEYQRQQDYEAYEGNKDSEPDRDGSRWERYKQAEEDREESFNLKEIDRNDTFDNSEQERQTTFNNNEGTVNDSPSNTGSRWARFKFNEASRQTAEQTRQTNERNRQTQETARQQAESQRTSTFNQSQAERQQAYQNAEGTSSDEPSATGSRWARYNKAEQDRNTAIEDLKETKANKDGYYSKLVSGAAENLVGHGTTLAEYTFRTSGGNADIGTGTATIDVIKGKTLKWQQQQVKPLNTTSTYFYTNGGSATYSNGVISYLASNASNNINTYPKRVSIPSGHKVYISMVVKATTDNTKIKFAGSGITQYTGKQSIKTSWTKISRLFTSSGEVLLTFSDARESDWDTIYIKDEMMIIDLTEMGLDSITTPAEFEALYPLDYYAYTATSVLINNAASGIVTTGFNQWDEEVVIGKVVNATTGELDDSSNRIASSYVKIFPNTEYYAKVGNITTNGVIAFYDANKQFISGGSWPVGNIITPSNAYYLRFSPSYIYGTTYKNDICINLSWSGYRNGEYEPYEKHTLYFDTIKQASGGLNTIKGKLLVNGEPTGDSVTIFPDGMKSAGSVYDFGKVDSDGYIRKVTKRIGSVDLGSLTITYDDTYFICTISKACEYLGTNIPSNIICPIYSSIGISDLNARTNMYVACSNGGSRLYIRNSSYSDAATFKAAMSGVMLYYKLATPEEYLLDTPISVNYLVNDFGTEQRIPVDTANNVLAPISYEVRYSMNAVDTMRRLPIQYISAGSLENFTTELASKLGAFLNATIGITATYNQTTQKYDYSISITANE